MTTLQAIILGLIQGITEFLPISSTAHLILVPSFLGWSGQNLTFDAVLHLASALAIIIYFWPDWKKLVAGYSSFIIRKIRKLKLDINQQQNFCFLNSILLATIPTAITGFLFESWIETNLHTPTIITIMLVLVALLMIFAEKNEKRREMSNLVTRYSLPITSYLLIGLTQILALIPGTSRSAITIITGMFLGLSRPEAANTSFLLSTPILLGTGGFELLKAVTTQTQIMDFNLLIAFLTTAATSFIAIKFLLKFLKTSTLIPFAFYRILLGFSILILLDLGI